MRKKYFLTFIAILLVTSVFSQFRLNDYKYVVIPRKYDFLKHPDQYQLNSYTKFLLEKENFEVYFNDERLPDDLQDNKCLALYGDIINESSLLKSKLGFLLKDCNDNVILTTRTGESKVKNFQKAYHQCLREAFETFNSITYEYQPKENEQTIPEESAKIEQQQEIHRLEKDPVQNENPVIKEKLEKIDIQKGEIESEMLTAKWEGLGYKVMDSNSQEVMVLLMTSMKDVFMVKGKDAILAKNDNGLWVYSENDGKNLNAKIINIKFQ